MKVKDLKEDFINPIFTKAISAEGDIFEVGDEVIHTGDKLKKVGKIIKFGLDKDTNDVMAYSEHGVGRISFLYHSNL